jgi:uncharacterized membrane protein
VEPNNFPEDIELGTSPESSPEITKSFPSSPDDVNVKSNSAHTSLDLGFESLSWQGPLPPPSILAQFDQVIGDGAERLFQMGEKEQMNRLENDRADRENIKQIVNGQEWRLNAGQITSSSIAIGAVLAGVILVFQGRALAGGSFIAGTAAIIKYLRWDGKSQDDRFELPEDLEGKTK